MGKSETADDKFFEGMKMVLSALQAYGGEPEKPRMMQANPEATGPWGARHIALHEWSSTCGDDPKCHPVAPAPKHKLEAGCMVRYYGKGREYEVVMVRGDRIITTEGWLLNNGGFEVTAPATPERGDYVVIHDSTNYGPGPAEGMLVYEPGTYADKDVCGIQTFDYVTCVEEHTHAGFTIIAKARHALDGMEEPQ